MKIAILGGGVLGVVNAYFLAKNGHEVTIVDRQSSVALETSYANGGQLSYSHAEPWATPAVLPKIAKWIFKKDSPLVFNFSLDPKMWIWGIKFLLNCTPKKADFNTETLLRLGLYSRKMLEQIIEETKIEFNFTKRGIMHIYKDYKDLDGAIERAEFQKKLDCPFTVLSDKECIEKEPTLKNSKDKIIGGIYHELDENGDVHVFTEKLAEYCQKNLGVKLKLNTNIRRVISDEGKITTVVTDSGNIEADAYILSLGSYSPIYSKQVGISLPIYPMKGYSISIKCKDEHCGPQISITDQSEKIVYSRLGRYLRVAGTAEFAKYNTAIREDRVEMIKKAAMRIFPEAGDYANIKKWACLRPQTPSGLPVMGKTKYSNLYLNTGHGTLGWTLAAGSGKIVADIIADKNPEINLSGMTLDAT